MNNQTEDFEKIKWEMGLSSSKPIIHKPHISHHHTKIIRHRDNKQQSKSKSIIRGFSQSYLNQVRKIANATFSYLFAPEKYDHCPITHQDFIDEVRCQFHIRILYANFKDLNSEMVWNPISYQPVIYLKRNLSLPLQSLSITHQLSHLFFQYCWTPNAKNLPKINTKQSYTLTRCLQSNVLINPQKLRPCRNYKIEKLADYFSKQFMIVLLADDIKNSSKYLDIDRQLILSA